MALISIIVPVYKVEPYLRRCVDSILLQTCTDFELILVDDGSPDKCGKICDEYAEKDSRIHVIHQENGGLSAARNAGIDWVFINSDSQWISFIDSDDWVHPCFLEYLYRAAMEMNVSVSACGIRKVEGKVELPELEFDVEIMNWDKFYISDYLCGVVAWNKLYRKELFDNLRYPIGKIHEDQFLTYKLLDRASRVAFINAEMYFYFQNPVGIMNSDFSLARLDDIEALDEQCLYAKKHGYNELYHIRRGTQITNLSNLITKCQNSTNLTATEKKKTLRFMRTKLQKLLLSENKYISQKKEENWYYECAYPKLMRCYWVYIAFIKRIKQKVNKDA